MAASTAIRNGQAASRRASAPVALRAALPARVLFALLNLSVLGCGSDTTSAPAPAGAADAYWSLELNQHAVMLALQPGYDTVQLTATPKTAAGAPLTTTGTVTFLARDTTVLVSATGLVTARDVVPTDQPVWVVATLQDPAQGVTHIDSVAIVVTATVPVALDTFSMQPVAGDSAKRALGEAIGGLNRFNWRVRALDLTGQQIQPLVYYRSSRPLIATVDPLTGQVTTNGVGHTVLTAQTLAYGQALQDSVEFRIGHTVQTYLVLYLVSVLGVLTLVTTAPKKLVLGVGATLMYCNIGQDPTNGFAPKHGQPIDVVFDHPETVDSASCALQGTVYAPPTGSGNIAPFGGDTLDRSVDVACRGFRVPGVYHYHSTLFPSDTYAIEIQPDP